MLLINIYKNIINYLKCLLYGNCIYCNKYIHKIYELCDECWYYVEMFNNQKMCIFCNIIKPCACNIDCTVLYKYNNIISKIILSMKYNDNINLSIFFANQMKLYVKPSILISIPTTIKKLKKRGYNQSVEICKHLSNMCGIKHMPYVLCKNRTTEQKNKNKEERLINSTSINLNKYEDIIGKDITIIDDVIASGATIQRCIDLLSPFVNKIYVIAIAKS